MTRLAQDLFGSASVIASNEFLMVAPAECLSRGQTRSFGDVGSMSGLPESGHDGGDL
jgi:hypothetical protein